MCVRARLAYLCLCACMNVFVATEAFCLETMLSNSQNKHQELTRISRRLRNGKMRFFSWKRLAIPPTTLTDVWRN